MDRTCGLDSTRPCAIRAATAKLVSMHLIVERLHHEWETGTNRFDKPGEALFGAWLDGRLVGGCGLNDCTHTARLTMPAERSRLRVASQGERPMLQLRPSCECCDRDLPPDSTEAVVCSFECTFGRLCADSVLGGRCPNCGGKFVPRSRRPAEKLLKFPASAERIFKPQGCSQPG
jgi:uncharacterized protein